MSKKQTRKLFAIITGLFLISQMAFLGSFNIPQAQAADTTPPAAPTNVKFTALVIIIDVASIQISWTNPTDSDFSHINIYRSTVSGQLGSLIYTNITNPPKTDTELNAYTTYYYTLRSVDTSGNESQNTDQSSITPSEGLEEEEEEEEEGVVSPTKSTLTASPIAVVAEGFSPHSIHSDMHANLIVAVRDENNNLLSGKRVTISSSRGSQDNIMTISSAYFSGEAKFWVRSLVGGVSTYTATVDGVTITQTAQVTFIIPGICPPDGTLISPPSPEVYVITNCKKKWIKTIEEFQKGGYNWSDVLEVGSPVIEALADYLETAELLRAIGHYKVYRIIDGKQLWIPTISAFNAQGLKWEDIQEVSQAEVNQYPRAKLLQATGDPKVYYITESGLKRHLINPQVFTSYNNKWEDIVQVTPAELNSYSDNILIKAQGDYKVYKIEDNKKRWIKTNEAFNRLNYDWSKIAPVNTTEINAYPIGTDIE